MDDDEKCAEGRRREAAAENVAQQRQTRSAAYSNAQRCRATLSRSDAQRRDAQRRNATRRGAAPSFAATPAAQHFQSKLAKVKEGEPTAPRVYVHQIAS